MITDGMIARAARAYVRAIQEEFPDPPDFTTDDWQEFEDGAWLRETNLIRKVLEAALEAGSPDAPQWLTSAAEVADGRSRTGFS